MGQDPTPLDPAVKEGLIRESRERILRDGRVATLHHVALMAVVTVLAYDYVPALLLAGWVVAVSALSLARMASGRRLEHRAYDLKARLGFRTIIVALALAWGLGFATFAHWLRFRDDSLFLVVLSGLVAAGTTTLAADRLAYRCYLAAILGPAFAGVLLDMHDTTRVAALLLIVLFATAMLVLHERAHGALFRQVETNVRLAWSEAAAAAERARLQALLASAPVAIAVLDLAGTVLGVNRRFDSLFGYQPAEAEGRKLNDLIVPVSDLGTASALDETVRSGERIVIEVERRRKDGSPVPVRASAARVQAGSGTEGGQLFVMYEDVSEEVRARQALREAKEAAENVARMRSAFLANMSHEIRTPMNAVLGLTELLLDGELTAEQRRSLTLIQNSGEALLALLNDILDLSKIEADGLHLETVPFDLHRLVEATVSLLAVRARDRSIELLSDLRPGVPEQVRGDPTRLRQVLTNLIGNAIKFTNQGEVLVSVAAAAGGDGKPAQVRFSVKDTGIGIPEDRRQAIFEPFSQADLSMTRKYGGTGLGLTIAQRLVVLMGGALEVTSTVGQGSEFFFTIPLQVEAAVPAPLPSPGAVKLEGLTVLVVDDNQSNRRIVREMLGGVGVRVDEASGAAEGLEALRRAAAAGTPYAVAVLDAEMPGMDGFEMAGIVRGEKALADTCLMMLTSAGQRGDAERCQELGIGGYLTKPVSRAELVEMIGGVLGSAETGKRAGPGLVTRHRITESRRHLTILLAEDNPVNQEVAATMLRKRGHHVDVVDTGRLAVERARDRRYDVVLMDIQMPELDGLEATRTIRALPGNEDVPIVALTAHALPDERERCLSAGMSAYVTKPFKAFELFAAAEGWGKRAPEPPPVDLETFRKDMAEAGVAHAVEGIVETFLAGATQRIEDITAAVSARKTEELARLAHAFKSSAAQIGAHRLAHALQEMETAAKEGVMDRARDAYDRFRTEIGKVVEYLGKRET